MVVKEFRQLKARLITALWRPLPLLTVLGLAVLGLAVLAFVAMVTRVDDADAAVATGRAAGPTGAGR